MWIVVVEHSRTLLHTAGGKKTVKVNKSKSFEFHRNREGPRWTAPGLKVRDRRCWSGWNPPAPVRILRLEEVGVTQVTVGWLGYTTKKGLKLWQLGVTQQASTVWDIQNQSTESSSESDNKKRRVGNGKYWERIRTDQLVEGENRAKLCNDGQRGCAAQPLYISRLGKAHLW